MAEGYIVTTAELLADVYADVEADINAAGQFATEDWDGTTDLLTDTHQEYFDLDIGPDGKAWPALSPKTVAAKGHSGILEDTLGLRESLETGGVDNVDNRSETELEWGTLNDKSGYHQFGTANIPQREHVGLNEDKADEVAEIVADTVVEKAIKGR